MSRESRQGCPQGSDYGEYEGERASEQASSDFYYLQGPEKNTRRMTNNHEKIGLVGLSLGMFLCVAASVSIGSKSPLSVAC